MWIIPLANDSHEFFLFFLFLWTTEMVSAAIVIGAFKPLISLLVV